MIESQYPVFQEGQTLTEEGLNLLRTFLHDRDRLLGRLTGFGINCGLGGEVAGTSLSIAPGLALDQSGEPLLLVDPVRLDLPPTTDGTFDFIETGPGGFTVVLESTDTTLPSTGCSETDCDGHAELHDREARLRVVAGRLHDTRFDFSGEPLLSVSPLRVSRTSSVRGGFVALRNAILSRIGDRMDASIRAKLADLSLESRDLPAIRAFKAAFLNRVLFATLDYLRCEALMRVTCLRASETPGVALGWVHQVGGTWRWECSHAHHWEPPRGLSLAVLGATCENPCGIYLERVQSLIDNFAVPVAPEPEDPPSSGGGRPGDYDVCNPRKKVIYRWCEDLYFPPEVIPEDWPELFEGRDFPPDPGWIDPVPPEVLYGVERTDWMEAGSIDLSPAWGGEAEAVQGALTEVVTGLDVEPNVVVGTGAEVSAMEGYVPSGAVSAADTIVITADAQGKVVATGHVPATRSVRNVGTVMPRVTEAANTAVAATERIGEDLGALGARVETFQGELGALGSTLLELQDFRADTAGWRAGVDPALAGLEARIQEEGDRILADVGQRLGALEANVNETIRDVERASDRIDQILIRNPGTVSDIGRATDGAMVDVMESVLSAVSATGRERPARLEEANRLLTEVRGRIL